MDEGRKEGRKGWRARFYGPRGRAKGGHSVWELPPWVSGFNSAARALLERGERATYTHNYSLRNSCLIWSGM